MILVGNRELCSYYIIVSEAVIDLDRVIGGWPSTTMGDLPNSMEDLPKSIGDSSSGCGTSPL